MCSQMARRRQFRLFSKAPLTSRDVMNRLVRSISTTASCRKIASSGEHPGIALHIVGGMA